MVVEGNAGEGRDPAAFEQPSPSWELLEKELGDLVWETDARLHYEHALSECAQALLSAADELALRKALQALLTATDATYAFVERNVSDPELGFCSLLVDEVETEGLDEPEDDGYWELVPWERMPISRSHLEAGQPFAFNIQDLTGPEAELYLEDPFPVASELDIPIFVESEWIGLVGFADRHRERVWADEDIRLLQIAAALIGTYWRREDTEATLRANLADRERWGKYERALAECSAALLKTGSDHALDLAVTALLEATEATSVFVERNVDHPELGLCTAMLIERSGPNGIVDQEAWALVPWSQLPISFAVLSRGEPFAFLIKDLTGPEAETYAGTIGKSELDIPIFVQGEWAGLIGFSDSVTERHWEQAEIEFLSRAAEMIGAFWERRAAYRRLEQLIESRDEFVASVSHELRTPLTVVVGLANELKESLGDFTRDEVLEFIDLIAEQGGEVANIVEDLLVVARAEIDKVTVIPEQVDLRELVESVVAGLNGERSPEIAGDAPAAWADPLRLRQVLRNLLTNAVRYGGEEVRVELGTMGRRVRVEVCDNGPGVAAPDGDKIFDAYQRAHDRKGQPASVGLGLTVSRQLAHLMGGELSYGRREGWTVFTLALPAVE